MPDRMQINDDVTIGAQPTEAELKAMSEDGFRTVINVRTDEEEMQPMSPGQEAKVAKERGMTYHHLPFDPEQAGREQVDRFRQILADSPKPAFVHCKLGKRAGALVMMDHAVRQHWTGDQTLEKADEMGFECENETIIELVRDYVNHAAVL